MQSSLQTEVILCPNCKEEVPKTLYCLNCGYPLYKEELDKSEPETEDVVIDVSPDPFSVDPFSEAVEEEIPVKVDESAVQPVVMEDVETEDQPDLVPELEPEVQPDEIEPPTSEVEEIEAEPEELPKIVTEPVEPRMEEVPPVEEAVQVEAILEELSEVVEVPVESVMEEMPPVEDVEVEAEPEVLSETVEEPVEPLLEEISPEEEIVELVEPVVVDDDDYEKEPEETGSIELLKEIEEAQETVAEEPVPEIVAEPASVFEPNPAIRDVMENFAKNISMKIRLVSLLRNDEVKMETFERLFDSYVARGELLMNSRNETLERVRFDLDARERALNEAKIGLEELKIRKAIGDVSEDEYMAKSPGFEWDISQYEDDVARKKAEIAYLDDLTKVMSAEEIAELREQGEENFGAIDGLTGSGIISPVTSNRINVTLEEALSCLKASCCATQ